MGAVLFNGDSVNSWQANENTIVMVTNRSSDFLPFEQRPTIGTAAGDLFCRAIDVRIGDNIWEHNIVSKIEIIPDFKDGIRIHYGDQQEANFIDEPDVVPVMVGKIKLVKKRNSFNKK